VGIGVMGDVVGFYEAKVGGHGEAGFSVQGVSDRANPQVSDLDYSADGGDGGSGLGYELGVNGVHEPGADLADSRAQDAEDRRGDDQADDRVGVAPAEGHTTGSYENGKAGEAVSAGVDSIGHQGGRAMARPTRMR
jgi:hypothetical protein